MDKTKEYILMCEKAVEIQKSYKNKIDMDGNIDKEWNVGDVLFRYGEVEVSSNEGEYGLPDRQDGEVWLPRQDQLQEIWRQAVGCSEGKSATFRFVTEIAGWLSNRLYPSKFTSMEQLWLAFVMKEKYNKIWTDKDWIQKENK